MVCTKNHNIAPLPFPHIAEHRAKTVGGCICHHTTLPLFYYAFENEKTAENACNNGYNYSFDYGNGYAATVTENLTSNYCFVGTCSASPDPYVQSPTNSQSFGRYTFCMNNPLVYVDEDGEFWHLVIGGIFGGLSNVMMNASKIQNTGQFITYFGIGAAVGVGSAAVGGWVSSVTQATGIIPGMAVGAGTGAAAGMASNVTLNGLNNAVQGQNFWNGWQQSAISGAVSGGITGGIAGGFEGYKTAKGVGANPLTGRLYTDEVTYNATLKHGIPLQPNPERDCYAYSLAYADAGRENRNAAYFLDKGGYAAGAKNTEVEIIANKSNIKVNWGRSISGKEWNDVGNQLGRKEFMAIIPQGKDGHWVNITGVTTANKMKVFGGGFRPVLRSTTIWDPIRGHVSGPNYFITILSLF